MNSSAIIVTFNKPELLKVCINSILNQGKLPENIIVVDNASNSDIYDYLLKNSIIKSKELKIDKFNISKYKINKIKEKTKIEKINFITIKINKEKVNFIFIRNLSNLGGAGGFFTGVHVAKVIKSEWLWLMDDDGRPSRNAFNNLINKALKNDLKVLNSLVVDSSDQKKLSFGLSKNILSYQDAENSKDINGLLYSVANPFNGTLISSNVFDSIGNIKKEMFIWGDETEYFLRIKKNKIKYATCFDSLHYHPKSKSKIHKILFSKIRIETKPYNLASHYYRNKGYIHSRYRSLLAHIFIFYHVYFYFTKGKIFFIPKIIFYYLSGILNIYPRKLMN